MSMIRNLVCAAVATAIVLPAAAFAALEAGEQKCIDKYNNFGRLVAQTNNKEARKCVLNAGKGKEANPEFCIVTNPNNKVSLKQGKVNDLYAGGTCTGSEPIEQGAVTNNAAMRALGINLAHDLFGNPVDPAISIDKAEAKCQDKVILRAGQLATEKLKTFRSCKKDGMKASTITDSATLQAACLPVSGIPDPKGKIGKKVTKLGADTDKNCGALTTRPSLFPGECSVEAATIGDFVDCVEALTECQVCTALNAADGLNVDCDLFDDGAANLSCYPVVGIGTHKCTFDSGSQVSIATQGLPLPPNLADGAIDIIVGTTAPDGTAVAECKLQDFDPMSLLSIGFICFTPGAACTAGEIDCSGGRRLDVTMTSDHKIGTCTGNVDCATQCESSCAPDSAYYSGCEGFCIGGANNGLPCTADTGCPGGSCPGKDGVGQHSGVCQCECLSVGGEPSVPGGLQCNLSVDINVEIGAPCGNGDILIAIGTRCLPLTTETITSQIVDANNTAAKLFPPVAFTGTGAPADCPALATSVTTGITLVGAVNFFDSTLGDLTTTEKLICQ